MSVQHSSARPSGRSLRVLIVDDEHLVADTLVMIVRMSGHDSLAVYTGCDAVTAMRTFRPDIVLSDVMMPGLNGFELAIQLAESFPACKVLLMSGLNGAEELAEGHIEKGHFFNVLTKPVRPQTILNFVAGCAQPQAVG